MDDSYSANDKARQDLIDWESDLKRNIYSEDEDLIHCIKFNFPASFETLDGELENFGDVVASQLETLVNHNNLETNLPQLQSYDQFGKRIDEIIHHPSYLVAGDIIYKTGLLSRLDKENGLSECLAFLFLSSQAGEAGHNCPIACSAGIIRVLQQLPEFPNQEVYLSKLMSPSFLTNFTGAQFLTEIQGGSDVGLNSTIAKKDDQGVWRIYGEKWFCSNAGAELIFVTARHDLSQSGTKGLALFLVPAEWEGTKNNYYVCRLKNKIGTRSMATGEIDFNGAYALQVGELNQGFHLAMDHVLHLSRLFNSICVLGMARRAYKIAYSYAKHRVAFGKTIIHYPLVQETLARIKAENTAMLAAIFATSCKQDALDADKQTNQEKKLLIRLLVNIQKYFTAYLSVEHIHLALGILAGNGAIETFSSIPRLLRDCIVCENWEGTHNVLRMQVYKDILKYNVDEIFLQYMHDRLSENDLINQNTDLKTRYEALQQQCKQFRLYPHQVQTFQIKFIVDEMAILYCAWALFTEALDQKSQGSNSKLNCYNYFLNLHSTNRHNDPSIELRMINDLISPRSEDSIA